VGAAFKLARPGDERRCRIERTMTISRRLGSAQTNADLLPHSTEIARTPKTGSTVFLGEYASSGATVCNRVRMV
jgi:hypothetical protein